MTGRVQAGRREGVPLDPSLLKKAAHQPEVIWFMRIGQGKKESKEFNREAVTALQQELTNRSTAVAAELQLLCNAASLVPVLGGVMVCQRAVDQVNTFFNAEVPFFADEPLSRPLLNSDLSRIPLLVMNKHGEIEGMSKPSFADSILRLVAGGTAGAL